MCLDSHILGTLGGTSQDIPPRTDGGNESLIVSKPRLRAHSAKLLITVRGTAVVGALQMVLVYLELTSNSFALRL